MRKKSSTPNRGFRVADQIQRDLTELIARELKDPRGGELNHNSIKSAFMSSVRDYQLTFTMFLII